MLNFIKLLQCSRRKVEPASPTSQSAKAPRSKKMPISKMHCDSDYTSVSTEPGDISNNEFSDASNFADSSVEGLGYHHAPKKMPSTLRLSSAIQPPPGLGAPPGLESMGLNTNATSFVPTASHVHSGLNAGAACFVPSPGFAAQTPTLDSGLAQLFPPEQQQNSQQLRQSIRVLKGALEEWESSLPATSPPAPAVESHPLLEALAKLTPTEAATVRSMLDSKLGSHTTASTLQQPGQVIFPVQKLPQRVPQRMQRPFTPFQGARTPPWEQAKSNKATPNTVPKGTNMQDGEEESLATQLRDLALMDNACILMVRKINRLGLNSGPLLEDHFSKFGKVDRVMVAPTVSKAKVGFGQAKPRVRPPPLGFVVMSKAEEATAALAHGSEHLVEGQAIGVFSFKSHSIEPKE